MLQPLYDILRPYWPTLLFFVVFPVLAAVLNWVLWWDTPERWEAFAAKHPEKARYIRILRAVAPHLRKLLTVARDGAAAKGAPQAVVLLSPRVTAAALSTARGPLAAVPAADPRVALLAETSRNLPALLARWESYDESLREHYADEITYAIDAVLRALDPAPAPSSLSGADLAAKAGAVAVSETRGFDPAARQAIAPDVVAVAQRITRESERGFATLRALAAVVVVLAVEAPMGALIAGCPRLPPVSGCQPEAQTCIADSPHVCSASQRWHRAGDISCSAVGGQCLVAGGRAYCAPLADGGVR